MPGIVWLTNRATGQDEPIDAESVGDALSTGRYLDPAAVAVHRPGVDMYSDPTAASQDQTVTPTIDPARAAKADAHAERYNENAGIAGPLKALAGGGVGGLTFGLLDPFKDAQEFNPIASGAGQVAGAFAPALVGDVGGLLGLGRAAGVADDALTAERATSALSSKALFAGERAEGAGELERGLIRANGAIDDAHDVQAIAPDLANLDAKGLRAARDSELDRLAEAQSTQRTAARSSVVDDVLAYRQTVQDANPWLAISEGEDAARLNKAKRALRAALDDPKGLRDNPAVLGKPLRIEEQALEGAIADREAIAAKLESTNARIASDLEKQLASSAGADAAAGEAAAGGAAEASGSIDLTGKAARRYASYADVKVPKGGALSIARDDAQEFLDALKSGEVRGASQEALGKLPSLLEQNRALQARLKAATSPLVSRAELSSERLTAIENARDLLSVPRPESSMAEQALSGTAFGAITGAAHAIPIIGQIPGAAHFIGAKGAKLVTDLVFGKLGATAANAEARAAAAASKFLEFGRSAALTPQVPALAARSAARAAAALEVPPRAPTATETLSRISFAASKAKPTKAAAPQVTPTTKNLIDHYRERSQEIRSLTAYNAAGVPELRPEARQAIGDRLAGVRAVSPLLADRMETVAARRVEFLSSILPRLPGVGGIQIGPERRMPSDIAIRRWARGADAIERPYDVLDRAAHGRVSPIEAQAIRAVYPELLHDWANRVTVQLPELQRNLPYNHRLALSILTGVPVDASMQPGVLRELQSMYANEPGTDGGTHGPAPSPQFGSVKRSEPGTPAQRREGLTS